MFKTDKPATLALLISSSQCCKERIPLEVLLDFLNGNLPDEPMQWIEDSRWGDWLAHIELFVNDLDILLLQAFLKENPLPMSGVENLYRSLPKSLQNSTYIKGSDGSLA